ncbi:PRC-barrel domain-containing protein [Myxococcota bacterium]|nr:PRC-barrel domain-containing protein [Myxococcota bacterium]
MSRDSARPRLSFVPRPRGDLAVPGAQHAGPVRQVLDLAFRVGSGRIAALRIDDQDGGRPIVEAVFTTPMRSGQVRVPPSNGRGWLLADPTSVGLRWVSGVRDADVVDCGGTVLGRVETVVVDHLRQQVTDLVLEDGCRVPADEIAVLGDGRLLVDEGCLRRAPLDLWLAWQQDLEEGRLWWREGLAPPPPLEPVRAAAGR